ncbi:MAG: hypothetical protein VX278_15205 [Myxococcota bacterium]|nr:hypothetical protein [Myxococcota bacterium]
MYRKNVRQLGFVLGWIASLYLCSCQRGIATPSKPLENMLKYEHRCHSSKDDKTVQELEQRSIHSVEQVIGYQMCGILPEQTASQRGICGQDFLRQMQRRLRDILYLPYIYALSPEEGAAIQHLDGRILIIPDLEQISAEHGSQISCFQGDGISLPSIQKMDGESILALSTFRGEELSLDGLQNLDVDAARKLSTFKGKTLSLDGLRRLDADVARALSAFKGDTLSLDGLDRLHPEELQALNAFKGKNLLIREWATQREEEEIYPKPVEEPASAPKNEALGDEQLLSFIEARETSNLPPSWVCAAGKVCLYDSDSALSIVDNRTAQAKYSVVDYGYPLNPVRLHSDGRSMSYDQLKRRLEATVRALGRRDQFTNLWIDCHAIALVPRLYHNEDIKRFEVPKPSKEIPPSQFQVMTPIEVNEHINDMRLSNEKNHFYPEDPTKMLATSFQNPRLRSYREWTGWDTIREYESYFVYSPEGKNVFFLDHTIEWHQKDTDSANQFRSRLKERTLGMLHELKVESVDIEMWNACECDFVTGLKDGTDVTLH